MRDVPLHVHCISLYWLLGLYDYMECTTPTISSQELKYTAFECFLRLFYQLTGPSQQKLSSFWAYHSHKRPGTIVRA